MKWQRQPHRWPAQHLPFLIQPPCPLLPTRQPHSDGYSVRYSTFSSFRPCLLSLLTDAFQGVADAQAKAPQDIRNVVNFLRSSKAGIKVRVGALNGKRTDYFKGAHRSPVPHVAGC